MQPFALRTLLATLVLAAAAPMGVARADGNSDACASGPSSNGSSSDGYSLRKPLRVVGLTGDGQLVCFSDRQPQRVRMIGTAYGFAGHDTGLIGIDFRAQDGLLYGVGNAGGLYRIDTASAHLESIGQLTAALDPAATAFGVDFNPAANALRIVSNTGQNLRQPFANLGTGTPLAATAVDAALNYTTSLTPGPFAMGVVGAAYTNNDVAAATNTTLYVLDSNLDQVSTQSPANTGILVANGKLGVDATAGGFDIYSVLRSDVTVAQRALAALTVAGSAGLYDINLLTGAATLRGAIGAAVVDIAMPLNQY
jgi:Domain of unknown function (DUF4394)